MSKSVKKTTKKKVRNLEDLLNVDNIKTEKSEVSELINSFLSNENMQQKTDLNKPMLWSGLDVMIDYFNFFPELKEIADFLQSFKDKTSLNLVSKNRLGRKEYVNCIQALGVTIENIHNENKRVEELF